MDGLRIAKVVEAHPEAYSVDIMFLDDGGRVPHVQVLSPFASSSSGMADLCSPDRAPSGDKWDWADNGSRDVLAVVGWMKGVPIVLGFLFPQVSQCLFKDKDRAVYRHASDVYWTIDGQGNAELCHPSGAFVRIATSPAHEDLTGADFDQRWATTRNTGQAVHIHIEQAGGTASLNIAPSGAITVLTDSTLAVTTGGTVNVTAGGNATLAAPHVTVDTPNMLVTGNISANGEITDKAESGGRSMSSMRDKYNNHTHPENNAVGGQTSKTALTM